MEKILLVSASETLRKLFTGFLGGAGYLVLLATSAEEAMAKLRLERPALVVTGLIGGLDDGLEYVRGLRALARELGLATQVLVVTGHALPADRARQRPSDQQLCLAAGADSYLAKPVSLAALGLEVERLLRGRACLPAPPQVTP